ncbi:uncharacterized protein TNCV_521461 [Trichonephila clavipes]|nr:uncharacterized protein TNCV_521461 [Trichonephila clavipes]
MEVDGMLRIFNRSEKLHNLKYSNYIGDGDTKTFDALSENKPYGDDHLIQKTECVGHVQKRMGTRLRKLKLVHSKKKLSDGKTIGGKGRLTDSLIDKLAHYYDLSPLAHLKKCLGGKTRNPNENLNSLIWKLCPKTIGSSLQIAEIAANLATSVLNDRNQILITISEKFRLKINRNVCVSLAERDNRRIFTSRQRRLASSFEARIAKKIKKSKEIELFQEQEDNLVELHFKYDQARRRFAEWAQNEIAIVSDFHKRILFSDEAHFWLNGYVNKQNCRIWSEANPQVYVETPLHPEKLTDWCALCDGIIGPYFFKNDEGHNVTVNGDRYRAMITNFFIPELNNHDVQELWFQQDGEHVTQLVHNRFIERHVW